MNDTARRALADLATSQHHVITRRQADSLGFEKRRVRTALRAGWLGEPTPGVLTIADARPTWQQSVMIVVLAAGGHGVASHRAAARLHHLDGFDFAGNATVEVSVTRAFRVDPSVSSVAHHVTPLDPIDVTTIDGIPCTSLYRTDASGRVVAKTDLGIPAVKLGLEAHSRRFHFGEDAEALDENRDIAASLCGWELTYLGWHATKRPRRSAENRQGTGGSETSGAPRRRSVSGRSGNLL